MAVVDYGTAGGDFRVVKFVNRGSLPVFKAPTLQQRNEILYCFNRKSAPWFNLDTLAHKRFGTNTVAPAQAAPERAS
jgi:hypothetical protein